MGVKSRGLNSGVVFQSGLVHDGLDLGLKQGWRLGGGALYSLLHKLVQHAEVKTNTHPMFLECCGNLVKCPTFMP